MRRQMQPTSEARCFHAMVVPTLAAEAEITHA